MEMEFSPLRSHLRIVILFILFPVFVQDAGAVRSFVRSESDFWAQLRLRDQAADRIEFLDRHIYESLGSPSEINEGRFTVPLSILVEARRKDCRVEAAACRELPSWVAKICSNAVTTRPGDLGILISDWLAPLDSAALAKAWTQVSVCSKMPNASKTLLLVLMLTKAQALGDHALARKIEAKATAVPSGLAKETFDSLWAVFYSAWENPRNVASINAIHSILEKIVRAANRLDDPQVRAPWVEILLKRASFLGLGSEIHQARIDHLKALIEAKKSEITENLIEHDCAYLRSRGRYDECKALVDGQKALISADKAYLENVKTLAGAGDLEAALSALSAEAMATGRVNPAALSQLPYLRAELLSYSGKHDLAKAELSRLVSRVNSDKPFARATILVRHAEILRRSGDLAGAKTAVTEARRQLNKAVNGYSAKASEVDFEDLLVLASQGQLNEAAISAWEKRSAKMDYFPDANLRGEILRAIVGGRDPGPALGALRARLGDKHLSIIDFKGVQENSKKHGASGGKPQKS